MHSRTRNASVFPERPRKRTARALSATRSGCIPPEKMEGALARTLSRAPLPASRAIRRNIGSRIGRAADSSRPMRRIPQAPPAGAATPPTPPAGGQARNGDGTRARLRVGAAHLTRRTSPLGVVRGHLAHAVRPSPRCALKREQTTCLCTGHREPGHWLSLP